MGRPLKMSPLEWVCVGLFEVFMQVMNESLSSLGEIRPWWNLPWQNAFCMSGCRWFVYISRLSWGNRNSSVQSPYIPLPSVRSVDQLAAASPRLFGTAWWRLKPAQETSREPASTKSVVQSHCLRQYRKQYQYYLVSAREREMATQIGAIQGRIGELDGKLRD